MYSTLIYHYAIQFVIISLISEFGKFFMLIHVYSMIARILFVTHLFGGTLSPP